MPKKKNPLPKILGLDTEPQEEKTLTIIPAYLELPSQPKEHPSCILVKDDKNQTYLTPAPISFGEYDPRFLQHCLSIAIHSNNTLFQFMLSQAYKEKRTIVVKDKTSIEIYWEDYEHIFAEAPFYQEMNKATII